MPRKYSRKNKRHRIKRGGFDIESGPVPNITPMKSVPPDPERFQRYDSQMRAESARPVSREDAESIFSGPNPEEKTKKELDMMANEDPRNRDPWQDLNIFSDRGGRRRSKKRRTHKRKTTRRRRH